MQDWTRCTLHAETLNAKEHDLMWPFLGAKRTETAIQRLNVLVKLGGGVDGVSWFVR